MMRNFYPPPPIGRSYPYGSTNSSITAGNHSNTNRYPPTPVNYPNLPSLAASTIRQVRWFNKLFWLIRKLMDPLIFHSNTFFSGWTALVTRCRLVQQESLIFSCRSYIDASLSSVNSFELAVFSLDSEHIFPFCVFALTCHFASMNKNKRRV